MQKSKEQPDFQQTLNDSAHLLRQNRPEEAVRLLEPLHKQRPNHPDVAINLGGAYILQRKWNKATKILSKAAVANPDNAMLWTNLAAAELGNLQTAGPRQQERAIRAYERALQIDPAVPNVHYHLGLIYKERGEIMRAAAFFQRALEIDPTDRDARHWIDRLDRISLEEQRSLEQGQAANTDEETDSNSGQDADANGASQ